MSITARSGKNGELYLMEQDLNRSDMLLQSTSRAFGCPQRYIQGIGEFNRIFAYGREYGDRFFFIIDAGISQMILTTLEQIEDKAGCDYQYTLFSSESCMEEVMRLTEIAKSVNCNLIIGVGGGKVIDTAKLVADEANLPRVLAPTSASNDAPAADWAAIYTPEGVHITGRKTRRNTELVLVDSQIISNAPARLFSAGIGDALATWYEAQACERSYTPNCVAKGYRRTRAAMAVCRECYEILMSDAEKALQAVKAHVVTEAVENVIEANTLLSGLGFINGGLAAAHGLHAGFSELPGAEAYLHGEKVAFGLICQLVMENVSKEELDSTLKFLHALDLPITLEQIGIELNEKNLDIIAEHTCAKNALIHHEPIAIDRESVKNAIIAADMFGHSFLAAKL